MKQLLLYLVVSVSLAYNTAMVCADAVESVLSQVTVQLQETLRPLH